MSNSRSRSNRSNWSYLVRKMAKRNMGSDEETSHIASSSRTSINPQVMTDDSLLEFHCLVPTLQHLSSVTLVTTLFKRSDIREQTKSLFRSYKSENNINDVKDRWNDIKTKIKVMIPRLQLPKLVGEELVDFVNPLAFEMFRWLTFHVAHIFDCNAKGQMKNYSCCVWTTRGTIDYQETARALLVKGINLSNRLKYLLACAFCLKEEIKALAPKVKANDKFLNSVDIATHPMVHWWTLEIMGKASKFKEGSEAFRRGSMRLNIDCTVNGFAFYCLIKLPSGLRNRNHVAMRFLWDRLVEPEKWVNRGYAVDATCFTDLTCYIISSLKKEDRVDMFGQCAHSILGDMLYDWLWRDYFLPTVRYFSRTKRRSTTGCELMDEVTYMEAFELVADNINTYSFHKTSYWQFVSIMEELWKMAPRRYINHAFKDVKLLCNKVLFKLVKEETMHLVRLILSYASDAQKKKILKGSKGMCDYFVKNEKFDLLDSYVSELLDSEDDIKEYKNKIIFESCIFDALEDLAKRMDLPK